METKEAEICPQSVEARRAVEPAKMEIYRAAWRAIKSETDDYDRKCHKLPCPSLWCDGNVYVTTLEELDAVRRGEHVCECCREHGGKSRRRLYYERACPEIFRSGPTKTDPDQLTRLFDFLAAWGDLAIPATSIFAFGDTGTRKSRTLWTMIERKVLPARNVSFIILGGGEFRELMLSVQGDYSRINETKRRLADVDLLCFDDFAQDALTDTMRADLWSILDKRFRGARPTIFLSNLDPALFAQKLGDDFVAKSLVRRIRDYAKIIEFTI